jgi:hypothetical protein
MNKPDIASRFCRFAGALRVAACVAVFAGLLLCGGQLSRAAEWHGLTPLKSRRADVERELGKPLPGETANGALNFKVAGGMVTVTFVTAKFAQAKKLSPEAEGTVLLIVLQHENSSDTPESVNLVNKSSFTREEKGVMAVYTNQREGITYTFFNGRLKTTRYAPSAEQLSGTQGLKSVL